MLSRVAALDLEAIALDTVLAQLDGMRVVAQPVGKSSGVEGIVPGRSRDAA
jgi:hypothetical protein